MWRAKERGLEGMQGEARTRWRVLGEQENGVLGAERANGGVTGEVSEQPEATPWPL